MRRSDYIALARTEAQKLLEPDDYTELINSIEEGAAVSFSYTDITGKSSVYNAVSPIEFFITPGFHGWPGRVYLWAFHEEDDHNHSFYASTIRDVKFKLTLIHALLNPSKYYDFWSNTITITKIISPFTGIVEDINKQTDIADKDRVVLDWLNKNLPATKTTIAGPSTDIEHEAYSMNIDGITLYFDEVNDAVVTSIREILSGAKLPEILKNQIAGVQIVAEDARGGPDVIAMSADGIVTIFGNRQVDIGVIGHEAAHDLAVNKWGNPVPPDDSDYVASINTGEPPVSEYSLRNYSEDFAEAVRMYVVDPAGLKKIAPLRHDVIQRLMTEKDYRG